jgi:hypothetical protein
MNLLKLMPGKRAKILSIDGVIGLPALDSGKLGCCASG